MGAAGATCGAEVEREVCALGAAGKYDEAAAGAAGATCGAEVEREVCALGAAGKYDEAAAAATCEVAEDATAAAAATYAAAAASLQGRWSRFRLEMRSQTRKSLLHEQKPCASWLLYRTVNM